MKKYIASILTAQMLMMGLPWNLLAVEMTGREELFFQDIPNVVTASRTEQKLLEAPAAIYVITAEEIKQSGATIITEALNSVTGMNIRRGVAGSFNAGGIRGLMKLPINKVVLMIDGRYWMSKSYNTPHLIYPIAMEEVERVEIMKGPGSSLYGSNAMTGIINIITKKTKATQGTFLSFTGGEQNTYLGQLLHGGAIGDKINYRLAASFDRRDDFGKVPYSGSPSKKIPVYDTTVDYALNQNSTLSFFGSYLDIRELRTNYETTGPIDYGDNQVGVVELKYESKSPQIIVRTSSQRDDFSQRGDSLGVKATNGTKQGTDSADFQHTWDPFEGNKLVWGAEYSHVNIDASGSIGNRSIDTEGIFIDDTHRFGDQFILNGGVRGDHHPQTKETLSHRLSALYFPTPNQRFRITWGSSFRHPDFIESYYYKRTALSKTLYYELFGHDDLKTEKAVSYELSYMAKLPKVSLEANAYIMDVKDFVFFTTTQYWPGALSKYPRRLDFVNGGRALVFGEEAEARWLMTKWLSGLVNYTHIDQQGEEAPVNELLDQTPENMGNAQLNAKFKNGLSANLTVNYVGETKWRYNSTWGGGGMSNAYAVASCRIGYSFSNIELALAVFNLANKHFDEYPIDSQDIDRRITGGISYKFGK